MEVSSTFWSWDIADWWRQQDKTHSKYTDLFNGALDILSIIPHAVWVVASFSLGWDVIVWRQSSIPGEILPEQVMLWQFAAANTRLLAGDNPALDTTSTEHDMEMKWEVEQMMLDWMAKVHDLLQIWQGSQNLRATQMESRTQNTKMTAVGYISDTEEIVIASWSHFQLDGAAALNCRKDHLCHQLCLQRTSLEDELKY